VSLTERRVAQQQARRAEAMSLAMAGLTYEQIGDRLGISRNGARDLIERVLATAVNQAAPELRAMENARLDRAQSAIWSKVLSGELAAVQTFLAISARRAKMNGIDEPTKVNLSINVRQEMEQALAQLEQVVLGETIDATSQVLSTDITLDDDPSEAVTKIGLRT
jgi:transposase